jgi:uncharacterized protein YjiS (DUF1127 family)
MRIYESNDGQWVLWTGSEKIYFATQGEAITMLQKLEYAAAVQLQMTTLASIFNQANDLSGIWADRDYLNQMTDEDLVALGITKAQLTAAITLFQQLLNFADNAVVSQADYRATVNTLRTGV